MFGEVRNWLFFVLHTNLSVDESLKNKFQIEGILLPFNTRLVHIYQNYRATTYSGVEKTLNEDNVISVGDFHHDISTVECMVIFRP